MSDSAPVQLQVNGQPFEAPASSRSLLDVLRHDLQLKATRMGCGLGQCGTCTVLVNGRAVHACQTPLWSLSQGQVTTVEGLSQAGVPHPLQAAFIEHQAVQCGFCTSGMLMRAHALLQTHAQPSDAEVRHALNDQLCRCGVQPRVVQAVQQAARVMREGTAPRADQLTLPGSAASPPHFATPTSPTPAFTAVPPPAVLHAFPLLGQWLQLEDGVVVATSGKVDIGQGISHALHRVLVHGLGTPHVRLRAPSTTMSPDEGVTSGSLSVQDSGAALCWAAQHLRRRAVQAMATRAGVPVQAVSQDAQGVFLAGGLRAAYADLADPGWWRQTIDLRPEAASPRALDGDMHTPLPAALHLRDERDDVQAKVMGQFTFIQDLELPGMLYGYVGRTHTINGTWPEEALQALRAKLLAMPGVQAVVRDGQLLGVLADREQVVLQAAQAIAQTLDEATPRAPLQVPEATQISAWLKAQPLQSTVVQAPTDAPENIANSPDITWFEAEFERPYLQHASIGLCCALAHRQGERLAVWSHTQGLFNLQRDLALALGLASDQVSVSHVQGAGCYGHNGADDVAFDAAWLASHTPHPVRVMWTRADEMRHSPLAPAMAVHIKAGLNAQGRLVHWSQSVWSQGHGTRPGRGSTPALLGAWQTAQAAPVPLAVNAPLAVGGGSERNAVPPYDVAQLHVVNHRVLRMPLRVSALRALGAPVNVLAAEGMMDELAQHLGQDAFAFRLAHLSDARARNVVVRLEALTHATRHELGPEHWGSGQGWGMAYARYKNTGAYCAVFARVSLDHEVRVKELVVVADVGQVISPQGVRLQLEGGALQALSWTRREQARWDGRGVHSTDWAHYPIDRFDDMPELRVDVIDSHASPLGAGECASGPTTAALANAVSRALGVRVRSLPLSGERLMDFLQQD